MIQHVFFDLDKTLTVSRSPMTAAHQELFDRLCNAKDVVVVTGGSVAQIREQITPRFSGRYYALAQSGNEAIDKNGKVLWNEKLNEVQAEAIHKVIKKLQQYFQDHPISHSDDLVEHRGAQITSSVLGFHAPIERKYEFDPDDKKRRKALTALSSDLEGLYKVGVVVEPAGTTSFNFIMAGKNKGYNVDRLCKKENWNKNESIYIGDALFPGGNDASVIGVIPTHAVKNPEETFDFIARTLLA